MNEAMNLIESLSSEFSDKCARPVPSRPSPPKPLGAKIKVEELSEKLNKLTEMLQAHKEEVLCRQEGTSRLFSPNPAGFPKKPSSHCGKISSQGSGTLFPFIVFIDIYENELHEFCDHPTPNINPCGPLFQSINETLMLLNQVSPM
ncbi:HAUS augmin-like complex subunit 7 [Sminthopsis crassicaudata]|uniref:HAUS augmin-like complex subunit 7 n=1 Tax=Sminthopsis crassicaudata TaxID=9301 RepID=UPI003D6843EE